MEITKICKKCVLPENQIDIFLNEQGTCNICQEHEKSKKEIKDQKILETDLLKILDKHRGKEKYDCLVMCSGGKDSTSALYFMKKRYKLNPLAFTFDHGFETEEALENINNAVEILKVDFLFFKSDFIQEMVREIVNSDSKAVICHPCSIWYMDLTLDLASRFDIPLIIAGWTKGQSSKQPVMSKCGCNVHQPEFISMSKNTSEFLENFIKKNSKYKNFPRSMEEVLLRAKKKHKFTVLSPHWFLPFSTEEYVKIIREELKWNFPKLSYPGKSTNCYLNFVSVANSMRHYGYTHYHVEMSKLIREALLSRDEALENLKISFNDDLLNSILKKLNP